MLDLARSMPTMTLPDGVTTLPTSPSSCVFPEELIEHVLISGWLLQEWSSPIERWKFFEAILKASHVWNRIMRSVVLHFRVLETFIDFQGYANVVRTSRLENV